MSDKRSSISGWFLVKVEEILYVLYTWWILISLMPSIGILRGKEPYFGGYNLLEQELAINDLLIKN